MAFPNHKRLLFICSPLLLVVVAFTYAIQTTPSRIKGATIQSRIYLESSDGKVTEVGTLTTFVSESGNWKTVTRRIDTGAEQVLVADYERGGVFIVSKDTAVKVGEFRKDNIVRKAEEYRASSQYAGETSLLGYRAFITHQKTDKGELTSEILFIPEFKKPVKVIDYNDDGTRTITQPLTITVGEPGSENTTLGPQVLVTGVIVDPNLNPKN